MQQGAASLHCYLARSVVFARASVASLRSPGRREWEGTEDSYADDRIVESEGAEVGCDSTAALAGCGLPSRRYCSDRTSADVDARARAGVDVVDRADDRDLEGLRGQASEVPRLNDKLTGREYYGLSGLVIEVHSRRGLETEEPSSGCPCHIQMSWKGMIGSANRGRPTDRKGSRESVSRTQ